MSNKTALLIIILCLSVCISNVAASESPYVQDEVLVQFAPNPDGTQKTLTEKNQFLNSISLGTSVRSSKFVPGLTLIKLPKDISVDNAIEVFKDSDTFLTAQPNYIYKTASTIPNDTRFDELWGML